MPKNQSLDPQWFDQQRRRYLRGMNVLIETKQIIPQAAANPAERLGHPSSPLVRRERSMPCCAFFEQMCFVRTSREPIHPDARPAHRLRESARERKQCIDALLFVRADYFPYKFLVHSSALAIRPRPSEADPHQQTIYRECRIESVQLVSTDWVRAGAD